MSNQIIAATSLAPADAVPLPGSAYRPQRDSRGAPHLGRRSQRRVIRETAAETLRRIENGQEIVACQGNRRFSYLLAKRLFDIVGAATLIVLLMPIMLVAFFVLLATTGGRPLFCQQRVGLGGRLFPMFKFRTMRTNAEQLRHLVSNEQQGPVFKNRCDPRITRFGRLLRKTTIDELPQLFNVLAGHMSLVGPRPPVAQEVSQYEVWQRRRLSIRPGLTCLWQVSGRCEIGFDDWVRMDIWYVKNQSLWTDLRLLVKTPLSVVSCRGAY